MLTTRTTKPLLRWYLWLLMYFLVGNDDKDENGDADDEDEVDYGIIAVVVTSVCGEGGRNDDEEDGDSIEFTMANPIKLRYCVDDNENSCGWVGILGFHL